MVMDYYRDKVTFNHEIDQNPKPEDAGRIKVYASIHLSGILHPIDWPTVFVCSLPAKDLFDNLGGYRWEQLEFLNEEECLNHFHVDCARMLLTQHVISLRFSSVGYSPESDCALSVYITFKSSIPLTIEEYNQYTRSLEESIFEEAEEEDMQISSNESTIDIRFRPASKLAVDSLSRKVYKETTCSSNMCTICLSEFKMGERIVALPCGHEFDDSCILEWFATNHVCPLCRFELPCEN